MGKITRDNWKLIFLIVMMLVGLVGYFFADNMKRAAHWASKPSETVCIRSHVAPITQWYTINKQLVPMTTNYTICDEEGPNPHYQEELTKWTGN